MQDKNKKRKHLLIGGSPAVGKTTINQTEKLGTNAALHDLDFARGVLGQHLKTLGERALKLDDETFKMVMGVEKSYWPEYAKIITSSFFELDLEEYIAQSQFLISRLPDTLRSIDAKDRYGVFSSAHFIPSEIEKMDYNKDDISRILLILSDEQEHWKRFSNRPDKRRFVEDNMENCFIKIREYQKFLIENSKGTNTVLVENDEFALGEIEKIIGD